jgi:hypothetical protein
MYVCDRCMCCYASQFDRPLDPQPLMVSEPAVGAASDSQIKILVAHKVAMDSLSYELTWGPSMKLVSGLFNDPMASVESVQSNRELFAAVLRELAHDAESQGGQPIGLVCYRVRHPLHGLQDSMMMQQQPGSSSGGGGGGAREMLLLVPGTQSFLVKRLATAEQIIPLPDESSAASLAAAQPCQAVVVSALTTLLAALTCTGRATSVASRQLRHEAWAG